MSYDSSRPGLLIPDDYSAIFARSIYDHREGHVSVETLKELRTRYGTERYFMEAVEAIYEHNDWKLGIKTKRDLKKIFKGI
jgi:hypothetical protein